jgi:hypothetical protein
MKMSLEHYQTLKNKVENVKNRIPFQQHREKIILEGKSKDIEKRLRWDYFSAATYLDFDFIGELYKTLNDNHIDTALRKIIKELQE